MGRLVTIDIETLPAAESVAKDVRCQESKKALEEQLKTALNGDFGQILCIGYIDEDCDGNLDRGVIGWDEQSGQFSGDERSLLIEFWDMLCGFRPHADRIIGHNIFDFDLKFIYKRSVIHGVRPSVDLSFARYRSQPIFDTMCEWERWSYRASISLDKLAQVLGLPSSKANGVDGSKVFDLFRDGQHRAIRDYCMSDVELTRAIYRRMVFADTPAHSRNAVLSYIGHKALSTL